MKFKRSESLFTSTFIQEVQETNTITFVLLLFRLPFISLGMEKDFISKVTVLKILLQNISISNYM